METPARLEPTELTHYSPRLADVVAEVVAAATSLGNKLPPRSAESLAALVRVMNCYYSNLIEGHDTRPRDIERALSDDLVAEPERRHLQLEARAHIRLQQAIDEKHARGQLEEPAQQSFIRWLHEQFYAEAPDELLRVKTRAGDFSMQPGKFRSEPRHDNAVGRHVPPTSAAVPAFMDYFEKRFCLEGRGMAAKVVTIAVAHHRFNFIHPFPDGNGRVSRLLAHAMAQKAGLGAHGLWSIARGLARGLADRGEYMRMMDTADEPRRSDLDGRGNLSLAALEAFVTWFCEVALDQLRFMAQLFDLDQLSDRLATYIGRDLGLSTPAIKLAQGILLRGELARGEAPLASGAPERTAREALRKLTAAGLVTSTTPKGAVYLQFTSSSAEVLFPRLFPAQG